MNTNTIIATAMLSVLMAAGAAAEGFKGPQAKPVSSVAEAVTLKDDAVATLEGYIVEARSAERYTFRDASGDAEIEIDNDDWRGLEVTPEQKVRIWVEVDRDWGKVELEVDRVELVSE